MRISGVLLLLGIAACGGGHAAPATPANHSTTQPGSIDGPGIGDNLAKCGVVAKDALCKCLSDDEVSVCDFVDDGSQPVHVLRVGNDQQTDTFLVSEESGGLRAISELLYEQHHGKRDSDLSDPKLAVRTIRGSRVVRLDYQMTASTDYAQEMYDETVTGTGVVVCVLDGAGAPSCPIHAYSACTVERTDNADPPNPANNAKGETHAHVDIADDGTATVAQDSSTGTVADCAVTPATVQLVK